MQSTRLDFPPEIWCHVCQYIPASDWPNVALVNRCLYGIIISDLYHHVEVVSRNPGLFVHAFQTLNRERDLTKRLRKLTLWIHALNEVIYLDDGPHPSIPTNDSLTKATNNSSSWNRARSLRHFINTHRTPSNPAADQSSSPVMDKHTLFMGVLSKLEHLQDLVLVWQLDVGYTKTSPTTCGQLVTDAWARVACNLRSLTLDMAMFNLSGALREPQEMRALEDLRIRITLEKHGAFRGNAARIFTNTVVPFINRLAPQLKLFSFTSLCNLNLDPLFQGMEPTPRLLHLILCLGFQSREMWDPDALQTFLNGRNHIQNFDLTYGECCASQFHDNWTFHDRVLVGEPFTGFNAIAFPQLESVTLGLQFRLSEDFLLGRYVSRFSGPSVSSLTLLGRSLPFTQTKIALAPFEKSLKSLEMFIQVLTPELLCLIATLLPSLRDLTLHVQSFSTSRSCHRSRKTDSETKAEFLTEMDSGLRGTVLKTLNQWQLTRIHVREFAYGRGNTPAWDVIRVIAAAIPSITSLDV